MQNALVQYGMADMERMAIAVSKSGMFNLRTPEAALSLFLLAQADGLHPMVALRRYHILADGRASMRADAMLADFRKAGGRVKWTTRADDVERQVGVWTMDDNTTEIGYHISEAKSAGYVKPGSGWVKDPAAMLRARTISRAIRMLAPEVVAGLYTPEEVADMEPVNTPPWKPVQEAAPAVAAAEPVVALPLKTQATPGPRDERPWDDLLGGQKAEAVQYLIIHGWLKEGAGLDTLKPAHVDRIRKNPAKFLEAVGREIGQRRQNELAVEDVTLTAAQKAVRDVLGGAR